MSVLNNINSNSLYDVSILTDGNNNVQFTDPVESANILPPFTTTNANNILGVNTNGTQLEYKQNELLPTINGLVSGRILSNNGTNALWVLNPAPDLTQFHNLIDGSVSAPTLSQASDSTTGIYFNTQEVDVSIAGTKQLGITSTGINSSLMTSSNGYVHTGAPAYNNLSIKNGSTGTTGVFCRESTSNVGIICNGASAVNCLTTGTTITTQTTTPKLIVSGTATTTDPQIQSSNDTAPKGGINITENQVQIVNENTESASFTNAAITISRPLQIQPNSTTSTPQILSTNSSSTGINMNGNTIYIVSANTNRMTFASGTTAVSTSSFIINTNASIGYQANTITADFTAGTQAGSFIVINPAANLTVTMGTTTNGTKIKFLCKNNTSRTITFSQSGTTIEYYSGGTVTTGNLSATLNNIYEALYNSTNTTWYFWKTTA